MRGDRLNRPGSVASEGLYVDTPDAYICPAGICPVDKALTYRMTTRENLGRTFPEAQSVQ